MIRVNRPTEAPAVLIDDGATRTAQFREEVDLHTGAFRDGSRTFFFDPDIYGHQSVKGELRRMQHNKCCFCEAYVPHISSGDVEHFRPKAGFRQHEDGPLERPGYYWLAYEWTNLLFCCEICNRRHKRNLVPLADPANRARAYGDPIERESPLFVNPAAEDPAQFISFHEEVPFAVAGSPKGEATIRALGLDREELSDDRLRHLIITRLIIHLALSQPDSPEGRQARDLVNQASSDKGEYASMVRAELARNYPQFRL